MAWQPAVLELVDREHGEAAWAERLALVVAAFRAAPGAPPVIRLVECLGPYLTCEDDAQRARATTVLAEVVEAAPSAAATAGEVVHLTQFFTSRLTDWPAVRGALRGCLALLSRRAPAGEQQQQQQQQPAQQQAAAASQLPAPSGEDAAEMMRACAQHVFVRALAAPDRQLALRLLAAALRGPYGQALVAADLDLLEYTIGSVDGEKDPRCLLLGFEAVRALLRLYHAQPAHSLCHDRLEEGAEELFEVLACYFPVSFTPPPGDPHRITRADLAAGLQACLAAEPLFAPHVVPLACEKLGSSLRQAKLDALALLGACAAGYGPVPLADHTSTIWAALRGELAAPAAEGLLPADLAAADELAAAASDALARCVAAAQAPAENQPAGGAGLADAVLADPLLSDVLACVRSPGADPAVHRRSALRAKAGVRAARALCAAGGLAAAKALGQLLPPLLDVAGEPTAGSSDGSWQARCLAWAAAVDLLEAAAAAPAGRNALPADTAALLQRTVAAAAAGLTAAATEQQAGVAAMEEDNEEEGEGAEEGGSGPAGGERWVLHPSDCSQQQVASLQLAALATVFGDAPQVAALQQQQLETAVSAALQLLSAAGRSRRRQQAAVAPLTALAGSSRAEVLAEGALPRLVAAAGDPQSAGAALIALRALATASSSLQLEIVVALDQAIQQQLPAAAAQSAAGSSDSTDSAALLLQLLGTATAIVSAASAAEGAAAAPAPAPAPAFLQLGQHLLDAVLLLPPQAAAGPELLQACAELAYHAVRGAAADQQQPLAGSAAEALQEQALGPLQATVCCALLAPLWPEAANACVGAQMPALVQRLAGLALEQHDEGPLARWAGLAAASLLNKWSADAPALSTCALAIFGEHLYPACGLASDASLPAGAPAAWGCLAAVVRGLAMRGCRDADAAVSRVVASLDAAVQTWQQQQQPDAGLVVGTAAAARFLGAVLDGGSGNGSEGAPGLGKQSHAAARPLWQQRLYTTTAAQLLPPLQRSQQAAAAASGSQEEAPQASPVLLLALGHLLRAAPGAVLQHDQLRMLPWLLECLAGLQAGPLADGQLLLALLLLLSDALLSDTGRRQVEEELLPRLVPALLGLLRFRASPAVRETALQCLLLLVELPYTALHPYRRAVAAALAAAVDDDRRAVRMSAARCRQAWTAA